MKHFKRCLLLFLTLTFLTACQAAPLSPTTSQAELTPVAEDVTLRAGDQFSGEIIIDSSQIEGVYLHEGEEGESIAIKLTEEGTQRFAQKSAQMLGEVISLWAGETCLVSPTIQAAITDGHLVFTFPTDINAIYQQLIVS